MADEGARGSLERLQDLSSEARERVEAALKNAIEREVVAGAVGGPAAANIFSRGWIFSRLTPTAEEQMLRVFPELSKLSATEFSAFATRLAEMKAKLSAKR